MRIAARTHIGNVRASNQDALLLQPGRFGLFGVADGMGGHKAGDVASRMAVDILGGDLKEEMPRTETLRRGMEDANQKIYREQTLHPEYSGMGTTMTVIWEDEKNVLLGHVGDSRAYLIRDNQIRQVSQDHSMVGELVRQGLLTEEEARLHPYRNIITRALGTDDKVTVDVDVLEKRAGDIYFICSDGLYEYVLDAQIQKIIATQSLEQAADALLSLALAGGGRDNISLVIAEVDA